MKKSVTVRTVQNEDVVNTFFTDVHIIVTLQIYIFSFTHIHTLTFSAFLNMAAFPVYKYSHQC